MICKVCNQEINEFYFNDLFNIKKHNICYRCFDTFPLIREKTIIDKYECFSIYAYKDKIKDLIYQLKGLKDYELKDVFLEFFINELNIKYLNYTIVYVPSYFLDDEKRGFNHVEEMFSCMKNKKEKIFSKNLNYKQSDHKYFERKDIKNIIVLNKDKVKNLKKVLIVDDVLTSGNTLKTCASLLNKAGVKDIKLLTICKASNYKGF